MPPCESGATLLQIINRSQPSSPIRSNFRSARAKVRLRCGSGMPSKSRNGWNVTIFSPSAATMRATSFGVPLNDSRSLSKISTPVKPAAAIASSFSASPPPSDTVAIEVCIRASDSIRCRPYYLDGSPESNKIECGISRLSLHNMRMYSGRPLA